MAELFHKIKSPLVPCFACRHHSGSVGLGGLYRLKGEPLVFLYETIRHIGEIAAIVILFIADLEITPREFLEGGAGCV